MWLFSFSRYMSIGRKGFVQQTIWPMTKFFPVYECLLESCVIKSQVRAQELTHWGREKNRRHFAEPIFKCVFLYENALISIKISLKFIPKGPINNIPTLVQIMAWRRPGDKPLSEPMMIISLTHICVARPQWVKHWRELRCTELQYPWFQCTVCNYLHLWNKLFQEMNRIFEDVILI